MLPNCPYFALPNIEYVTYNKKKYVQKVNDYQAVINVKIS